jgi:CubicO group peptidase (beta-lactamase class C family)
MVWVVSGCQVSRILRHPIPASSPVGLQDERIERIGRVVRDQMRKKAIPGVSIAVVDEGQLVWAQGFGWRDVGHRLPVDTETQFQAGSISKPVTALGVLQLAASGTIALDTDVNSALRDWQLHSKYTNSRVTIRLLLCHRGGTSPHGFKGFGELRDPPSLREILRKRYFLNGPVKVVEPPGEKFRYSGGGYCVVQQAIEDVTGEPFETVMGERLLGPLSMNRSHFRQPPPEQEATNCAGGYGWMKALAYRGRWGVFPQKAAAGLWTTPVDLARLIVAVQEAQSGASDWPISQTMAEEFLKPHFDEWMGLGVFLEGQGPQRRFFHGGQNPGYAAHFFAGVSNGRGCVIMTNTHKSCVGPIHEAIVREFGWSQTAQPAACGESRASISAPNQALLARGS